MEERDQIYPSTKNWNKKTPDKPTTGKKKKLNETKKRPDYSYNNEDTGLRN